MELRLGPLLRYVDDTRATVWVETSTPCEVEVLGHRARTWTVHGHHYALVRIEGLTPGSETPYEVRLDGDEVWPLPDSEFGPSVIRTPRADGTFRLTFGSCRRSAPFDEASFKEFGPDALVALADRMAAGTDAAPDAILLLGDQVYADDPSSAVLEKLREAHGGRQDSEVADEIGNFAEYTWLYDDSWLTPAVRWLFSTVPLCMLLDDHDLRDDWNTSLTWRRWVTSQPWWHDRVVGAYASYWVYQHLGNLSPEQLDQDATYRAMLSIEDDDERTAYLDSFAWAADEDPASTRWSFYRDFGARVPRSPAGRGRLALLAAPRAGRTGDGRRARVGVGPAPHRRGVPADPPSAARVDAAVPARARAAPPGGLGRGGLVRCLGTARRADRREDPAGHGSGALGLVPEVVRRRDRPARRTGRRRGSAGVGADAVRRRALQLHRRGTADSPSTIPVRRSAS